MRILTLIIALLWTNVSFAQGKFEEKIHHKVQKVKETKPKRTKNLKRENLGYGNKRKLRFAYGFSIYNHKMHQKAILGISDDNVIFASEEVGNYAVNSINDTYYNTINIKHQEVNWSSSEIPSSYEFVNKINSNRQVVGLNMELRSIKDDGLGSPTGFFITSGIHYVNRSLEILDYKKIELLFPLGIGVIIPGNDRFRVELSGSTMLGHKGSLGGKFDFSIVWKNVKFSPSFMYLHSEGDVDYNSGGVGFGVSFIPIKHKRYKRR